MSLQREPVGLLAPPPSAPAGILISIGSTGLAVAAILGLVLNHRVPGTPEETGVEVPSLLMPEASDLSAGQDDWTSRCRPAPAVRRRRQAARVRRQGSHCNGYLTSFVRRTEAFVLVEP